MKNTILSFFEQTPKRVACCCDSDWEDQKIRWHESDILKTLYEQGMEERDSVPHEIKRRLRAEELIEMGKSYRPLTTERQPDAPDLDRD
jgi:hypothetical protein